jgi:hypothetical protein
MRVVSFVENIQSNNSISITGHEDFARMLNGLKTAGTNSLPHNALTMFPPVSK